MYDEFGNWIDDGSGSTDTTDYFNYDWSAWDAAAQDYMDQYGIGYDWAAWDEAANNYLTENYPELANQDSSVLSTLGNALKSLGTSAFNNLTAAFTDKNTGGVNWKSVAAAAGGLYGLYQSNQTPEKTGYQGGIPKYEAVREAVPNSQYDPNRRPGSGGQRYFSNTTFAAPGEAATAARTAAKEEAAGLEALNRANPANQRRPDPAVVAAEKGAASEVAREGEDASKVINNVPVPKYAGGGITTLTKGRYLGGATDGMADKIPARIDGKQEAKLSHGEFVIPADVVGHLGNGNSEAGAQRLYAMMDKIRQARTGTTKQGKQINPDKFLPA